MITKNEDSETSDDEKVTYTTMRRAMHRLTVKSVSGVLYILFLRSWLESNVYKSQSRCVGIVHADLRNFYVGLIENRFVSELPPRVCLAVQKKLITQFTYVCFVQCYICDEEGQK
eukprot:scaffold13332_cov116-Skeletonema_marinoi.AAC.1